MKDEDIDYSDIPPLTDEELAAMRPLVEVFPDLVQSQPKRITLQLDQDVVQWFKQNARGRNGSGYQALINAALRDFIARQNESRLKQAAQAA